MEAYIVTEDQARIHYQVHKTGARTLLFLHGWGGNQLSFLPTLAALEGDYTVITYDHRGFGTSDHPDHGYCVERLVQDLDILIERLELRDVILVGWSMGGVVAATYLETYGAKRVAGLVLVDVNVKILCDENYTHGFYDGSYTKDTMLDDLCKMARDIRLFAQEMPEKNNMTLHDQAARAAFVEKVVEQNPQPYPPLAMWLSLCQINLTSAYAGLSVPVLFCHGGTSTYCPPKACEFVMSLLEDGHLAEFPECSHFIPIERPQEFARAIDQFVQEKIT